MKAARPSRIPTLATFKPRVERQLRTVFADALTAASDIDDSYARLIERVQDQTLRSGKRLRPYLAFVAYAGSGGRETAAFMPVAASLELVHQFLLAHDDIIDRDLVRYGGPNIAGVYEEQFRDLGLEPGEAGHYAGAYALLAGDAAWSLAHRAVLASDFSYTRRTRALDLLERTAFQVIGGQLMDVQNGVPGAPASSYDRLLAISQYKTASYTFQAPLEMGALMAGASAARLAPLLEFGAAAGTAFQLTDDMLGVFGDQAALGKSVLSDMREGKQTMLMHFTFRGATPAQRKTLKSIWGNRSSGTTELEQVQDIVRATKALEKVEALAQDYLDSSLQYLDQSSLSAPAKTELERLAKFAVARKF
jgi:geranylgeranyl diphosphate synthase type II